jgi:hypothetical protein
MLRCVSIPVGLQLNTNEASLSFLARTWDQLDLHSLRQGVPSRVPSRALIPLAVSLSIDDVLPPEFDSFSDSPLLRCPVTYSPIHLFTHEHLGLRASNVLIAHSAIDSSAPVHLDLPCHQQPHISALSCPIMQLPTFRSVRDRRTQSQDKHQHSEKPIDGHHVAEDGVLDNSDPSDRTQSPTHTPGAVDIKRATRLRRNWIWISMALFFISVIFSILVSSGILDSQTPLTWK